MDNYKVYVHINKINNKKYVGITKQNPRDRWRHDGVSYKTQIKFYRAIQKYGWDNFEHIILFENLTAKEAGLKEQELIKFFDSYNNGYNADLGGSVTNHSEATREKMRQSMLGKKHTQETKDKIKKSKIKDSLSVICIETNKIYNSLADAEKATGIDKSSISKCCRGIMLHAGGFTWRYANIEIAKNYMKETCNRKDKTKKSVICLNTGKIYQTVSEAAKDTNSDASNIIKVCKGKYKTTNNLKWSYYNENE